jgi:hypothetical protein
MWFVAWFLVGAVYALALLSILSLGIFVLPVAIIGTVLLARRPSSHRGVIGIVGGLGLPPLYVAYLNRRGPGTICTHTAQATSCIQEYDPWIWTLIGLFFVLLGVVVFLIVTQRDREKTLRERPPVA